MLWLIWVENKHKQLGYISITIFLTRFGVSQAKIVVQTQGNSQKTPITSYCDNFTHENKINIKYGDGLHIKY